MRTVKSLVFLLLVSSLASTLAFMQCGGISTVRASPSVYQGDLTLTGNNVTVIEGQFDINGSIIIENNATLILRNAVVNFTQTSHHQFGMTLQNPTNGNPRLIIENTTLLSGGYDSIINFFANSSCTADQVLASQDNVHFWLYDSSHVSISNSHVFAVIHYGGSFEAYNSSMSFLQVFQSGFADVSSSYIDSLLNWGSADVIISDSAVNALSTDYQSLIELVNSTYNYPSIQGGSRVTVSWYLNVNVTDEHGAPVNSANVTAAYLNSTVAASKLTDVNGLARFTLMEKMINATGSYPVGNYTITATYGAYTGQKSVNMTNNQAITILLAFTVPEFPSFLALTLFMITTPTAVAAFKRRQRKLQT